MLSEHSYTNYSPSTIRKFYRSRKICSVPKCLNRSYRYTKTSLHRFPQNELRAEWGRILHIKKIPKNAYACSDHFTPNDFACMKIHQLIKNQKFRCNPSSIIYRERLAGITDRYTPVNSDKGTGKIRRLKKTAVPSRNIPSLEAGRMDLNKQNVDAMETEAKSVRRFHAQKKDKNSFVSIQTEAVFTTNEYIPADLKLETTENIPTDTDLRSNESISTNHEAESKSIENVLNDAEYEDNENISTDDEAEYKSNENRSIDDEYSNTESLSPEVELKIDESTQTEAELTSQMTQTETEDSISRPVTLLDMLYSYTDEQVQEFTGLESIKAFRGLCDTFKRLERKICRSDCRFEAKLEDRILLTLMKLKMNCSFPCLSAFFHTTTTSAVTYFYQTVRMMHRFLKHFIPWPTRDEVRKNLPKCFDRFPTVRLVLDYWEFPVDCCGCAECSVRCYSFKKGTHTLKAEFGLSPAGLITHISPVYGGGASDKFILTKSGILDKLEVDDRVMTIEKSLIRLELEERRVKLIHPLLGNDDRFNPPGSEDIYHFEQARVHIQRSIQRLKTFKILSDKVSWSMVPYFDEIIGVICGIINLSPPVLADN